MLQVFESERFLFDQMILSDREALEVNFRLFLASMLPFFPQSLARMTWEVLKIARTCAPGVAPASSAPSRVTTAVMVLPPPISMVTSLSAQSSVRRATVPGILLRADKRGAAPFCAATMRPSGIVMSGRRPLIKGCFAVAR